MRRQVIILLGLLLIALTARGEEVDYVPLPPSLDGSMMPYDFSACTQLPVLPDSLQPVCAAYVARHGARYLSGPHKLDAVLKELHKARNHGTLSDTGEAFLKLMEEVERVNKGNWGDLSPEGIAEERRLGTRMHLALAQLSDSAARVAALSSYVPRVVMTMYEFTHRLVRENDLITVRTDEGRQFDSLVCCFIYDKAYAAYRENGSWKEAYDSFVEREVPAEPAERLFTETSLSDKKLRKLSVAMYEVLKGNRAAGLPAPTTQWMSRQEYYKCWEADNLKHYLRNTDNEYSTEAGRATAPLLRRMIEDTDKALGAESEGKPYDVLNCYFGHCETLLPLYSLIQLPRCRVFGEDLDDLADCWKIEEITPLGANLLLMLSRGPSGKCYAVMQMNGRSIQPMLGEPDVVCWDKLRSHWMQILKAVEK